VAVPKKKTSKSRSRSRKAHDALKIVGLVTSKVTGSVHRPHHIDSEGYYNGRAVLLPKVKSKIAAEAEPGANAESA
jgi:large subunit ribosomal protein L32